MKAYYHWLIALLACLFLGACLDLGMPVEVLSDVVARLRLAGISVESRKASRGGFTGVRFRVLDQGKPIEGPDPEEHSPDHHHRHDHEHHHAERYQPADFCGSEGDHQRQYLRRSDGSSWRTYARRRAEG